MIKYYLFISVIIFLLFVTVPASDSYVIVVNGIDGANQDRLEGYPGLAYGKMIDRVYLYATDSDLNWLTNNDIPYRAVPITGEPSGLYLCYGVSENDISGEIYDIGDDYILADNKIADYFCRYLKRAKLPFSLSPTDFSLDTYDYNPVIDSLMGVVEQDSLIDFLTRLTGESSIEINGEIDTILTRYSGTEGNQVAAQYLFETLEDYGYQTEYHGFYYGELRNVCMHGNNIGWVVENNGKAYRTGDGINWNSIEIAESMEWWGVANSGTDSVWVSGRYGNIYFSSNGGDTWQSQNSGSNDYLFGICFINTHEGWIAGDYGQVFYTSDGGNNWETQTTSTEYRLYDICFIDSDYGWAVGRNGAIIHTSDGGQSWETQDSQATERLYGVNFIDRNTGWLVGWDGVVRYTVDGGDNWQAVDLGDSCEKYAVEFTSAEHGCVVGWSGKIHVTFDGGDIWEEAVSNTGEDLYGVCFSDDNNGVAVGNNIFLYTDDGGLTWSDGSENFDDAWRNVIATKTGTTNPDEQVVICGHFDNISQSPESRATGADDNGSGTMAVMEAARLFANSNFERTIKFCLWTGEEQGLYGSAAYAADAYAQGDNIVGVYNYDMIAWDSDDDYVGELHCGTMNSSIEIGDILVDVIDDYNVLINPEFLTNGSTSRSDHASFWDYNYPAILGIEDFSDDFNPHYHTTDDNMSIIVPDYFTQYVKAAVGAAATLAIPDTIPSAINDNEALPDNFLIAANYPNPFNARTVISFNLPFQSYTKLTIYDLLGRQVELLVDGQLNAGQYKISWSADGYSSGLYFYRLETDYDSISERMILLK